MEEVELKRKFVEYQRHSRHDWLNHIQVIKGNLALGRIEEAQKYLDRVIIKAHEETEISKLGDAELAYFLLTYNWEQNELRIDVEFEAELEESKQKQVEISKIGESYPYLMDSISFVINKLREYLLIEGNNQLLLIFRFQERQLLLTIELEASWENNIEEGLDQIKLGVEEQDIRYALKQMENDFLSLQLTYMKE